MIRLGCSSTVATGRADMAGIIDPDRRDAGGFEVVVGEIVFVAALLTHSGAKPDLRRRRQPLKEPASVSTPPKVAIVGSPCSWVALTRATSASRPKPPASAQPPS